MTDSEGKSALHFLKTINIETREQIKTHFFPQRHVRVSLYAQLIKRYWFSNFNQHQFNDKENFTKRKVK